MILYVICTKSDLNTKQPAQTTKTLTQHKIRKASSLLLLRFMFCALALGLVWDVVVGVAVLCLDLQILNNGVLIIAYWSSIHGIL